MGRAVLLLALILLPLLLLLLLCLRRPPRLLLLVRRPLVLRSMLLVRGIARRLTAGAVGVACAGRIVKAIIRALQGLEGLLCSRPVLGAVLVRVHQPGELHWCVRGGEGVVGVL